MSQRTTFQGLDNSIRVEVIKSLTSVADSLGQCNTMYSRLEAWGSSRRERAAARRLSKATEAFQREARVVAEMLTQVGPEKESV